MISFFALSLSCLNAGARIIYPMARHSVFPARLGTAYPVYLFPYIFLAYMVVGAGWLFVASRRRRGILREIETDLEAAS
jgi:amino acid transporter